MRIRFLKQLFGSYGDVGPGDEKDVAKSTAKELVALGYAVEIDGSDEDDDQNTDASAPSDADAANTDDADEGDAAPEAPEQGRRGGRRRRAG